MGENGNNLIQSNAWKPFKELIDRRPGFKVFKKGSDRNASAAKNPGAAEFVFATFDLLTITPIQHNQHDMLHFWRWAMADKQDGNG